MSHTITSVRTMFSVSCVAERIDMSWMEDGGYAVDITANRHTFRMLCERFEIDSTLRPVFSFSDRYPEPAIGSLMPYVPANLKQHRDRGMVHIGSPSGYKGDDEYARCNGDDTVSWVKSELWEEMDSSAVAEYGKYCVGSDTLDIFSREAVDGLSCSGWDIAPNGDIFTPYTGAVVAELHSKHYAYVLVSAHWAGHGSPNNGNAYCASGNNLGKLMRAAKRAVAR